MPNRVVTSIRIDEELLQKAKKIGLNISRVTEKALRELMKHIESDK